MIGKEMVETESLMAFYILIFVVVIFLRKMVYLTHLKSKSGYRSFKERLLSGDYEDDDKRL